MKIIFKHFNFFQTYSSIEICQKMTYQVILKNQLNRSGIEIDHQNPTRIFLSNVKKDSEGERLGKSIKYIILIQ